MSRMYVANIIVSSIMFIILFILTIQEIVRLVKNYKDKSE